MRSRWISVVLFAVASLLAAQAWAQQGYTIREVDLKQEPFTDAATLATLPEKTTVTITKRQGGWMQITSGQGNGWIRMLSVRLGDPGGTASTRSGGSSSWFASLFSLGRSSNSGAAVTTGVRGLDKEQIANAAPNFGEVQKMESYTVSQDKARQFAGGNPRLGTQSIDYLAAPSGFFGGSSGGGTPPPGSSPFSN